MASMWLGWSIFNTGKNILQDVGILVVVLLCM